MPDSLDPAGFGWAAEGLMCIILTILSDEIYPGKDPTHPAPISSRKDFTFNGLPRRLGTIYFRKNAPFS